MKIESWDTIRANRSKASRKWALANPEKVKIYAQRAYTKKRAEAEAMKELRKNKTRPFYSVKKIAKDIFGYADFVCYIEETKKGFYWWAEKQGQKVCESCEIFKTRSEAYKDLKKAMF